MTDEFGDGGVLHGAYLGELTAAVVARDHAGVQALRDRGVELLGSAGVVRAIGVAAGFDGINRVADAIGIPLDERFESLDEVFWAATRIDRFTEAR
ncbi:MAG: hypothetical protein HOH95_03695 [Dehalococcoidia bacterium]|nr:hypothetical protein [Dehalococcoidia bacterium]